MDEPGREIRAITSTANPLVKLIRQLASRRRARHREGLFLVEGPRAVEAVVTQTGELHTLIIDEERRGDVPAALLSSLAGAARQVVTLTPEIFRSIADAEQPQPLMAIAAIPDTPLPTNATCIVALDAVREPGNMGTIIRTACAAGVDGIALLPGCVDPFNPKSVRASAGMVVALPIQPVPSVDALLERCFDSAAPVNVVAADANGMVDYRDVHWEEPVVVVVGNEASGVGAQTLAATTHTVRIPMARGVESLNVSVATGILLFEMRRHRTGHTT